ncbi:Putative Heat shock protein DnaJ domain protein [Candidatus Glomeribacter gigasporarum BEG34]|uniref:Putative Heat shock protein DnaJ domain protein n=1 Tax=Candidatus Glomeribacter gigasporarum BEG34 TaxID=1070319 RepID=G2JBK6_9BURK|nr:hypothetical protein [Candidatus Glomeribacter gigasporarum]CCD30160.1 Putative Heat shock protein DnaJ domain protein [Candidatus Glomeribacter gigasporarum BEG34]
MHSVSTLIRIDAPTAPTDLSKAQQRFNRLIKKIDQQRNALSAWQQTIPRYRQKHAQAFEPLADTFRTLQFEFVQLLDTHYPGKAFTQSDRKKIRHLICNLAGKLMVENENETLKAIYNRHSESDFDADLEEGKEALKEMMRRMLGVELEGEIDLRSPEQMFAQLGEKMQEKIAEEKRLQQERRDRRKKSAKTLAKEKQAQEEAQRISQSLQEVYRKLASSLHPDKELDCVERARKTALMQQVNTAYEKKDLLRLLELQLAAEQIDLARLNTLTEARLAHYNTLLNEQSKELACEVGMLRSVLAMHFDTPEEALSLPDQALAFLDAQIQKMKGDILKLKADLSAFQDMKTLKKFLKSYVIQSKSPLAETARAMGIYMSY